MAEEPGVRGVRLRVRPITMTGAREHVDRHHSHHDAPSWAENMLFASSVEAFDATSPEGRIVCVAIAARPRARMLCDGTTLEITRVASDGTPHAASKCIASACRAAVALGYLRIVSYTLLGESGASYRAAGWRVTGLVRGGSWDRTGRGRDEPAQPGDKARWEFGPFCEPEDAVASRVVAENVGRVSIPPRKAHDLPLFRCLPLRGDP